VRTSTHDISFLMLGKISTPRNLKSWELETNFRMSALLRVRTINPREYQEKSRISVVWAPAGLGAVWLEMKNEKTLLSEFLLLLGPFLLFLEVLYRSILYYYDHHWIGEFGFGSWFFDWKGFAFLLSFAGSISFAYIYLSCLQPWKAFPSIFYQYICPSLHILDSFGAIILGIGLYYEIWSFYILGLLILSYFGMITVVKRLFVWESASNDMVSALFVHFHTLFLFLTFILYFQKCFEMLFAMTAMIKNMANYYFVDRKEVIVIITFWQVVSTLRNPLEVAHWKKLMDDEQFSRITTFCSFLNNFMTVSILIACLSNEEVREGFARSAVGHIAFLLTRIAPTTAKVLLLAAPVANGDLKETIPTTNGLRLSNGKTFFLLLELALHVWLSCLFLYWRLTMIHEFPLEP
jgi:hypothetical protein